MEKKNLEKFQKKIPNKPHQYPNNNPRHLHHDGHRTKIRYTLSLRISSLQYHKPKQTNRKTNQIIPLGNNVYNKRNHFRHASNKRPTTIIKGNRRINILRLHTLNNLNNGME